MKKSPGRPKKVFYTKRTIVQIDDITRNQILKFTNGSGMSMSEFFRIVAEYAINNPHIITKLSNDHN
jgi:antitoxin component of RelBE/YafQ-DinJ toxin-antitoxin module